jgi:hypothetical protein
VLAGVTFVDATGALLRREQLVGLVVEVADGVVALRREVAEGRHDDDDELVLVPADEESFKPARPGRYALSGTGQVVVDPDFLCAWTVVVAGDEGPTGRPPS